MRVVVACLCLWGTDRAAVAHPKPGAHADIRVAVQDRSVRVDLLMNLMFVDGLIAAPREASDDVRADEEGAILAGLRRYFASEPGGISGLTRRPESAKGVILDKPNHVLIDGIEVTPLEVSYAIIRPAPESRPGFEQNPLLLIPQVHLVLEYGCKQPPSTVELRWGTFPLDFLAQGRDTPPPVEIEAQLTAEGDIHLVKLTRSEPGYIWHGTGRSIAQRMSSVPEVIQGNQRVVPVATAAVVVAWLGGILLMTRRRGGRGALGIAALAPAVALAAWGLRDVGEVPLGGWGRDAERRLVRAPGVEEAGAIFVSLQGNVYRAFDYTSEPEIYDALARSVDGPLLDTMYNEVYRTLVMYEEGGAVSRVKSLQTLRTDVELGPAAAGADQQSFQVTARWRLEGVVYHWGHSHTRLNEYLAKFRVAATGAGWRIVSAQTLEQFRLDPATGRPPPGGPTANEQPSPSQEKPAWHPNR